MRLSAILLLLAMLTVPTLAADGPIRHVVSFRFKQGVTPQAVQSIVGGFANLQKQIPLIRSFSHGLNVSPEGLARGHTHMWILTFANAADRDAYLVHPAHKAFVERVKEVVEEPFVFDYVDSVGTK